MTCPNWNDLALRRASGDLDPADWRQALSHLDSCDDCRRPALASDPLLVFRHRRGSASGSESEAAAVAEMRRSVHAVVRSRSWKRPRRALSRSSARRLAAALALLAFLLFLGPDRVLGPSPSADRLAGPVAATPPDLPVGSPVSAELIDLLAETMPVSLVEDIDRPGARVYEMRRDNLSVVMIVDDTFDV